MLKFPFTPAQIAAFERRRPAAPSPQELVLFERARPAEPPAALRAAFERLRPPVLSPQEIALFDQARTRLAAEAEALAKANRVDAMIAELQGTP